MSNTPLVSFMPLAGQLMSYEDDVHDQVVDPQERYFAFISRGTLHIWDMTTRTESKSLETGNFQRLAISPTGDYLAASCIWTAQIYRMPTLNLLTAVPAEGKDIGAITFSPTDAIVVTGEGNGLIRLWQLNPWKELKRLQVDGTSYDVHHTVGSSVHDLLVDQDGKLLAAFNISGRRIADLKRLRYDLDLPRRLGAGLGRYHSARLMGLAFNRDGRYLASASTHALHLWDTSAHSGFLRPLRPCLTS